MTDMKSQIKGNGKYLYAIIPDKGESSYGDIGIDGNKVYSLCDGKVAAVVSDMANGRIRPERRPTPQDT